jgi:hypothetical protein
MTFGHPLDFFLTFQVKGASRRSNEAVRHFQDHFGASTGGTLRNSVALYTVPLTQSNDLFPL